MLSPRHTAQLGLGAACLTLVTSVTLLVAGASDSGHNANAAQSPDNSSAHVAPLASGQLSGLPTELGQKVATAKQ